jgi:hypothetical protein
MSRPEPYIRRTSRRHAWAGPLMAVAGLAACASGSGRAQDSAGDRLWLGARGNEQFVPGATAYERRTPGDPLHLEIQAESWDRHGSGAVFQEQERRRSEVAFEGDAQLGAGTTFEFEGDVVDSLRAKEHSPWGRLGGGAGWRQTRAAQTEFRVGLADDRIRLRSTQALSQFDQSIDELSSENGLALGQSVEADLVRNGDWLVSTFVRHSLVDDAFQDAGLPGGREDPRGRNRQTLSMGGTVGWGPFGLTFARETGERVRDGNGYEEERLRTTVSVGLDDLWQRAAGGSWPGLAPDAVWVSFVEGDVDPGGSASTRDQTSEQGVGVSWAWDSAYADLSLWRYLYDGRQADWEEADWIGHGATLSVGTWGPNWNVDASVGLDQGDNQEPYSRSKDTNLYADLSVGHRPVNLPDLRASLSLGTYRTDYLAYDGEVGTNYGELSFEADFSKFLKAEGQDDDAPSLALLYWFRRLATADSFADDQNDSEHVVGMVYKMKF